VMTNSSCTMSLQGCSATSTTTTAYVPSFRGITPKTLTNKGLLVQSTLQALVSQGRMLDLGVETIFDCDATSPNARRWR
jgi:hypothetical protein